MASTNRIRNLARASTNPMEEVTARGSQVINDLLQAGASSSSSSSSSSQDPALPTLPSSNNRIQRRIPSPEDLSGTEVNTLPTAQRAAAGTVIVTRVNVDSITDYSKLPELLIKLRSKYSGDFGKCRLFDYVLKPASNSLMVEIDGFLTSRLDTELLEKDMTEYTLEELQPFIEYLEKSDRTHACGPQSTKTMALAIGKIVIKSIDDFDVNEDWSLQKRTLNFVSQIQQILDDGGIHGLATRKLIIENQNDFLELVQAIIKPLNVKCPKETDGFRIFRDHLFRVWRDDKDKFNEMGGNLYPLLKDISQWGTAQSQSIEQFRKAGWLFQPSFKETLPKTDKQPVAVKTLKRTSQSNDDAYPNKKVPCVVCGRMHSGDPAKCLLKDHPNANTNHKQTWAQSFVGKEFLALGKDKLPESQQIVNGKLVPYQSPNALPTRSVSIHLFNINLYNNQSSHLFYRAELPNTVSLDNILLDSGAEGGNYINNSVAELIDCKRYDNSHVIILPNDMRAELKTYICMDVYVSLVEHNTILNRILLKHVKFYIFDKLSVDLIIGLPTIRKYNLTSVFHQYYANTQTMTIMETGNDKAPGSSETESKLTVANVSDAQPQSVDPPLCMDKLNQISQSNTINKFQPRQYHPSEGENADQHFVKMRLQTTSHTDSYTTMNTETINELKLHQLAPIVPQYGYGYYDKSEFLTEEEDEDYAEDRLDACPPLLAEITAKEPWKLVHIEGSDTLKEKLENLLRTPKYSKIFSETTSPIPSKLTPIRFEVDEEKWFHDPYNRQPTRMQSLARQYAIDKFLAKAIADGIIKPSSAPAWSQLFLTPKKNGDFRICLDYRNLNKVTKRIAWPIPRIDEMLQRIGSHRPSFFAVFDLTSGYFQCPIYTESQKFTTFATSRGNFMWTRLPMGQSNAPAHFQQEMTMTVFPNEMYKIIEIYLDDLLTWASTEDELIERLTIIFDKLVQFNITLNPTKCKLGLTKVEYVGHTIDKMGVHFSKEKLDSVLNFPVPTNHEELRSFLGLCTYFSSHVENFADLAHDLRMSMNPFKKSNRIQWTDKLQTSYDTLRKAVGNCPILSFPEPEGEIMVETDASDYAIGAAVFQNTMVNGASTKKPIAFLSKQLTNVEKRWSTIEKEAFAIFVALMKWEWLLRDIPFTLHTDHKNLTFIEKDARGKVKRWKLAIQPFNFQIYWLKGEKNILADKLSRSGEGSTSTNVSNSNNNLLMPIKVQVKPNEHYTYFRGEVLHKGQLTTINAYNVIGTYHGTNVGHMGYDKTINRLETAGYNWATRSTDVQMFIRRCPCCQKMKLLKTPIITNPYTVATYHPMDRLNIDTIGPMPEDQDGFKYIIVIIDSFTRFIELYKAKDLTGSTAAQVVLQHVGRYGTPMTILSDNGTQFKNELVSALQQALQVTHNFTTPYSHEENSMVERANKEVNRHLRSIVYDKKLISNWSQCLPLVQRILNSQVHSATKVSPAQLLFGNSIDLERRMFTDQVETLTNKQSVRDYIDNLLTMQNQILSVAQGNQLASDMLKIQERHKGPSTEFPINSYVLFMDPSKLTPSGSTKLNTPHKGPYRVVNRTRSPHRPLTEPEDIYVVENLISHELKNVSVHTLQPFEFDGDYVDPTTVATTDNEEFFIEKILSHEPNISPSKFIKLKKDQMRFIVKYLGYETPEVNTWENLRRTEALHQYLHNNGMKSLIPPAYRINTLHLMLAQRVQI